MKLLVPPTKLTVAPALRTRPATVNVEPPATNGPAVAVPCAGRNGHARNGVEIGEVVGLGTDKIVNVPL